MHICIRSATILVLLRWIVPWDDHMYPICFHFDQLRIDCSIGCSHVSKTMPFWSALDRLFDWMLTCVIQAASILILLGQIVPLDAHMCPNLFLFWFSLGNLFYWMLTCTCIRSATILIGFRCVIPLMLMHAWRSVEEMGISPVSAPRLSPTHSGNQWLIPVGDKV